MSTLYPGAIDDSTTLPPPGPNTVTNAGSVTHAILHDNEILALQALETKLGIGSSTSTASTVLRASSTGTSTWGKVVLTSDVTGTLPVANGGTGAATHTSGNYLRGAGTSAVTSITPSAAAIELGSLLFPIGTIYSAVVSTNPGTLLGFGTWVAFGQGQVLVGVAASGTFATAGSTGGEETHTLTTSEMPAHTHDMRMKNDGSTVSGSLASYVSGNTWDFDSTTTALGGTGAGDHKSHSTGGGGSHNNLQPYVVVYMWKRTV